MTRIDHAPNAVLVGYNVDSQFDFMMPPEQGGRLYVKDLAPGSADAGATQIVPALVRADEWMRRACELRIYSGDAHAYGDREIDPVSPDPAKGTYGPHCMKYSEDPEERAGAAIIPEIAPENPVVLLRDASEADAREVARTALREGRAIEIEKKEFSVVEGNPAVRHLFDEIRRARGGRPLHFVFDGVAMDVCVTQAVEAVRDMGYGATVITDAIWGLGLEPKEAVLERWADLGVQLVTLEEIGA